MPGQPLDGLDRRLGRGQRRPAPRTTCRPPAGRAPSRAWKAASAASPWPWATSSPSAAIRSVMLSGGVELGARRARLRVERGQERQRPAPAAPGARRRRRPGCSGRAPRSPHRAARAGRRAPRRSRRSARGGRGGSPAGRARGRAPRRAPITSSSDGSPSASALKAGSRSGVVGDRGQRREIVGVDRRRRRRRRAASARPAPARCPASHLLNGSPSWASRKARSAAGASRSRITGAEKPRRSDGTGRDGSSQLNALPRLGRAPAPPRPASRRRRRSARRPPGSPAAPSPAAPASAASPARGRACSARPPSPRSTVTRGVPACAYQRLNCARSRPEASSNTAASPRSCRPARRGARSRGRAPAARSPARPAGAACR